MASTSYAGIGLINDLTTTTTPPWNTFLNEKGIVSRKKKYQSHTGDVTPFYSETGSKFIYITTTLLPSDFKFIGYKKSQFSISRAKAAPSERDSVSFSSD